MCGGGIFDAEVLPKTVWLSVVYLRALGSISLVSGRRRRSISQKAGRELFGVRGVTPMRSADCGAYREFVVTPRLRLAFVRLVSFALLAMAGSAVPAAAQGFFDSLFNGDRYSARPRVYAPREGNSYAEPSSGQPQDRPAAPQASYGTGRTVAYCVRLCDGRYFPISRYANATPVQLCSAFCPAAKTQVFNGGEIDHAVSSSGARYADLDNAFVYRQRLVADCTCNGRDAFGLAKIDVASDPTLKPGDIVATGDNVKAALTAMMAAKERREAATNERTEKRADPSRRVAAKPFAPPADPEERPED
jgi:hypothetical protein